MKLFLACLFHYDLNVGDVMRFVGNNYTGEYRNVAERIEQLRGLIDDELLTLYARVMLVGAPAHFVAETTRENAMLHWRDGNHPSIAADRDLMYKATNKLEKITFFPM